MNRHQVSTFHDTQPETAGALAQTSSIETGFGDAVVSFQSRDAGDIVGSPTGNERARVHCGIERYPIARVAGRQRSFRECDKWEGLVTDITDEGIVASLSRRYRDFPAEEAFIPWDEIQSADRPLVRNGATFQLKVGYLQIDGQNLSVTHIEFRRVPNFSPREQSDAVAKAASYASLFDNDGGSL